MIDVNKIRADFPILNRKVNGKPLVYFDNGATTQKPKPVIDAIVKYYSEQNANIHRGVHTLSSRIRREATGKRHDSGGRVIPCRDRWGGF